MQLHPVLMLFGTLLALSHGSLDPSSSKLYQSGNCSTVRFRTGCLLDALEKTCESVKDIQSCMGNPTSCKAKEEFPVTPEIFTMEKIGVEGRPVEGVWKCCCDAPDGRTRDTPYGLGCNSPDPACMEIVNEKLLGPAGSHAESWAACLKKGQDCQEALNGMVHMGVQVQDARSQLLDVASCPEASALAKPTPWSKCGDKVKPSPWSRPIERADVYCDTISWQFYEMGSSDAFSSQCPMHPNKMSAWVASRESVDGDDDSDADADDEEESENTGNADL